jgi:carbon storage regulator
MLTLRRKVGETIHLGPDITITVWRLKTGSVDLAIEAPRAIVIQRGEHFEAIERLEAEGVEKWV